MSIPLALRRDPLRLAFALAALSASIAFAWQASEAQALAAVARHAAWCLSGAAAPLPGAPATLLGHCAACWGALTAAAVGAATLTWRPRA